MNIAEIAAVLKESDFFDGCADEDLQQLSHQAVVTAFTAGQHVFDSGDVSDALYVVLQGRVRIVRYSDDGQEITLGLIEEGEIFGEIALLDGGSRSASAYAQDKSLIGVIKRSDFFAFLETNPRMTIHLLVMICGRLRNTIDQVHSIALMSLEARLARLLLTLAASYGKRRADGVLIDLKIGQKELGAFIATTRESVGKQLGIWRDEGLIGREGGKIVLLDLATLTDLAGDDEGLDD